MLTIFVCEDCGRQWDCEGSPRTTCPRCGGGGRKVADDDGDYCFDCGYPMENCTCVLGSHDGIITYYKKAVKKPTFPTVIEVDETGNVTDAMPKIADEIKDDIVASINRQIEDAYFGVVEIPSGERCHKRPVLYVFAKDTGHE